MRKLIVTEFVSLDGVMEAPGGEPGYAHTGWVAPLFSDELGAYKLEELEACDVLLLGRRTYDSFYGAWPERDGAMADKTNAMRKLVASTTLAGSDWEATTVTDDLLGAVRAAKAEDGGPIIVPGSRSVFHALLAAGLVDELHLQVFPLVLGSGMRWFPERETPLGLELASAEPRPNGVITQTYTFTR
jgi:dihydrofolate reductase